MPERGFYHLTRTPLETALPKLLGRVLALGERAVVLIGEPERLEPISTALWLSADPDWLPHGHAGTGHADLQPIWLTTVAENPNGARHLFLVAGADAEDASAFARVFDLFDGEDEAAVAAARRRWAAARARGETLTYWQQTERGWERKGG
ncbi:DNA polymerase III subunit chi [Elioraea tepida]|uniref:DNA polymerase III subunit chi n=1 Tax=Elioraea tepida TaxID=2843330 RepID=A0A975U095_9PROT|nr:DNA polymerase III subunit chi [Elioraea tepida]QXM23457.1 DNA polymerase III subunit chi [Elioraea tepida]